MMMQLRDALVELWKEFNLPLLAPLSSAVPTHPSVARARDQQATNMHIDNMSVGSAASVSPSQA
jgi:hypothetical protein